LRGIEPRQRFEDTITITGGDPGAAVGDENTNRRAIGFDTNGHVLTMAMAGGVIANTSESSCEELFVAFNAECRRLGKTLRTAHTITAAKHSVKEPSQGHRTPPDRLGTTRQLEEATHELVQPLDVLHGFGQRLTILRSIPLTPQRDLDGTS